MSIPLQSIRVFVNYSKSDSEIRLKRSRLKIRPSLVQVTKYMEEKLEARDRMIDKLKLKNGNLKAAVAAAEGEVRMCVCVCFF